MNGENEGILLLTILVIVYLFITGYLGFRGYRGTRTASDYLVAGRQIHPFVMALSYGATFISTSAIVGFGGVAAVFGLGILWLVFLNIFVGIFIAVLFFGERTRAMGRRLDAHTFPEFLGRRFQSKGLQAFAALVILLFMPLYAAVVLMGAARFIEVRIGGMHYEAALFTFSVIVAIYVIMGGLKGVMYTDALQGLVMFIGLALVLFFTYSRLGGVVSAHQQLTDLKDQAIAMFGAKGHRGWTAMPAFGSPNWWTLVSTIILGVGIGVLAQPQLAVRFMTVKSERELNRGVLIGGVFILVVTGVAYLAGGLSNVLFYNHEKFQAVSIVAANKDVEAIIPLFIKTFMPLWLGDVFMITLLAAAMSTASSQFHAMGTAAGRDLYENLSRNASDTRSILASRLGILFTFILSVYLAYLLPIQFKSTGTAIIARGTSIFFALCAATFLPMYIGGLYSRGITKAGAIWGGLSGFFASALWLVFVHQKEAEALLICKKLFGRASLLEGKTSGFVFWQEMDALVVALPLSILVTIAVSAFSRKLDKSHLDSCFARAR